MWSPTDYQHIEAFKNEQDLKKAKTELANAVTDLIGNINQLLIENFNISEENDSELDDQGIESEISFDEVVEGISNFLGKINKNINVVKINPDLKPPNAKNNDGDSDKKVGE